MLEIIEQYRINQDKIKEEVYKREKIRLKNESEEEKLTSKYHKEVRKLESEKNKKIESLTTETEQAKGKAEEEINKLAEHINKVDRIIRFLNLKKKELEVGELGTYRDRGLDDLGYFFNDDFLKVKLAIVETNKPKNKFSLVAMGNCLFKDKDHNNSLLSDFYSYGVDVYLKSGYSHIAVAIKELPTKEELKEYLEKNKDRVLSGLINQYKQLRGEYEEYTTKYKLSDFDALMKPREVTEKEAVLICSIKGYKKLNKVRLFNGYYYSNRDGWRDNKFSKEDIEKCPPNFISVDGEVYGEWCHKDRLHITQTGNTLFGNWWSVDIEEIHPNKYSVPFTKKNYEREIKEITERFRKENRNRKDKVKPFYPKVEWYQNKEVLENGN